MKVEDLPIMGMGDAHKYLEVSYDRFYFLVYKYQIPYKEISCGRVFLKKDLDKFQAMRKASGKIKKQA